jgi:hypothetical protein
LEKQLQNEESVPMNVASVTTALNLRSVDGFDNPLSRCKRTNELCQRFDGQPGVPIRLGTVFYGVAEQPGGPARIESLIEDIRTSFLVRGNDTYSGVRRVLLQPTASSVHKAELACRKEGARFLVSFNQSGLVSLVPNCRCESGLSDSTLQLLIVLPISIAALFAIVIGVPYWWSCAQPTDVNPLVYWLAGTLGVVFFGAFIASLTLQITRELWWRLIRKTTRAEFETKLMLRESESITRKFREAGIEEIDRESFLKLRDEESEVRVHES